MVFLSSMFLRKKMVQTIVLLHTKVIRFLICSYMMVSHRMKPPQHITKKRISMVTWQHLYIHNCKYHFGRRIWLCKKYRFDTALYMISLLAHDFKIVIDKKIRAPGHEKCWWWIKFSGQAIYDYYYYTSIYNWE